MTVYILTNTVTKKSYVGSCQSVKYRMKTHKYSLSHHRRTVEQMQKDYDLYGWESFALKIIGWYKDWNDGKRLEKFYMQVLRTYDPRYGYNYKDRKALSPIKDKDRRQAMT